MRRTFLLSILVVAGACTGIVDGDTAARAPGEGATEAAGARGGAPAGSSTGPSQSGAPSAAGAIAGPGAPASAPPPAAARSCDAAAAGPAPLRRLTRREYDKAVQRLLGAKVASAEGFVDDERVGPFVSNADASPSDAVVSQYLTAAEQLAAAHGKRLAAGLGCAAGAEADCGRRFIEAFGRRAYRRPLTAEERARYQKLFDDARAGGGLVGGVEQVLATLLQSPHFLYHIEAHGAPAPTGVARLEQHALAARLAFFLTGAPPDDALLAAAERSELARGDVIEAQARRLLATADGLDTLIDFHRHWLEIDRLPWVTPDQKAYPEWNTRLRATMEAEATAFLRHVMTEERGRLDALFSVPYLVSDKGARLEADPARRAGVLTHPAVLTVSPRSVQRGRMIRTLVLCGAVPSPPPDVAQELPPARPGQSPRQRWEALLGNPACGACHSLMNPIGFAFDNYDELGRWRETDEGLPIDSRGEIVGGDDAGGKYEGAVALSRGLARSAALQRCVAEQWTRYALGRELADPERCAIEGLARRLAERGLETRELLVAIVGAPFFGQLHVAPTR